MATTQSGLGMSVQKGTPTIVRGGNMAKLTAAARKRIPKSEFGVPSKAPGSGSYPMPDKAHARNAKARASQFASPAVKAKVDAKADRVLGKGKGKQK